MINSRRAAIAGCIAALSFVMGAAHAGTVTTVVVAPSDLANSQLEFSQAGNPIGTNHFGYDFDSAKPTATAGAPAGFGTSSFAASVVEGAPTPAGRYITFRVGLAGLAPLFGHAVTVGDLASITYFTNSAGGLDWHPTIYTVHDGSGVYNDVSNQNGNTGSFYHSRLQAFPVPDGNGQFDLVTNSGTTAWTDTNLFGGNQTTHFAFSSLTGGPITFTDNQNKSVTRDVSTDVVNYIDFTLGANSGGRTEAGQLDGITFTLKGSGDSVVLNLESVPLPKSAVAGLVLIGALGASSLLRRKAAIV